MSEACRSSSPSTPVPRVSARERNPRRSFWLVAVQLTVHGMCSACADASPAKAAKTKDTGKDEDEERPDEPENEEDLQDIEAGRLSKRTQETAALLARNLEGSRRANVSAQTLLKGKVRAVCEHAPRPPGIVADCVGPLAPATFRRARPLPHFSTTCSSSRRAPSSTA